MGDWGLKSYNKGCSDLNVVVFQCYHSAKIQPYNYNYKQNHCSYTYENQIADFKTEFSLSHIIRWPMSISVEQNVLQLKYS